MTELRFSDYELTDEHARAVYTLGATPELREFRGARFDAWIEHHDAALLARVEQAEDVRWEYRVVGDYYVYPTLDALRQDWRADRIQVAIERRRKCSRWEPLAASQTGGGK